MDPITNQPGGPVPTTPVAPVPADPPVFIPPPPQPPPPSRDLGGDAGSTREQAAQAAHTAADQATQVAGTAKEQASQVAGTAAEQASAVASTAADGAHQVAATASEQAGQLATTVKEQAATVKADLTAQAHDLIGEARTQVTTAADDQAAKAAQALRGVHGQLRAIAEGRPEEARQLVGYASQLADRLAATADRLEHGGVEGVLGDVRRFARRKPGTFLLLAGAAGIGAGMFLKGARQASQDGAGSDGSLGTGSAPQPHPQLVPALPPPIEPPTVPIDVLAGTGAPGAAGLASAGMPSGVGSRLPGAT